jgi:hypothetical protein
MPGEDLFPRLECRKHPQELEKWILLRLRRPQNHPPILEDELHPVSLSQAQPVPNLDRNGNLPFAADRARWRHLYFPSLGKDCILYLSSLQYTRHAEVLLPAV